LGTSDDQYNELLSRIRKRNSIFTITSKHIKFASSEVRRAVMSTFVESCLHSDSDLQIYLAESSRDSLQEYCRLWNYKRKDNEACLFIPPEMEEQFIKRLDVDVLIHPMVEERAGGDGRSRYTEIRKNVSRLGMLIKHIMILIRKRVL
jgi:hypothetical protein